MKKIILIFLLCNLFLTNLTFAQKGSLEISVNNGFNYSNFRYIHIADGQYYDRKWKPSYRYGFGIKKEIFKNFHIGAEINIEEKGWLVNNAPLIETTVGIIGNGNVDFSYVFLGMPIFLDYSIQHKRMTAFVEGGIVSSIRRGDGSVTSEYPNTVVITIIEPSYLDPKLDFGLSYGTGLKFNVYKNWNVSLIGRYAFSVTGLGYWGQGKYSMRHKNYTGLVALSYTLKKETKK